MISTQHVVSLGLGNYAHIVFPGIRENRVCTLLVEPADLIGPAEKDSPEHQATDASGMRFRVGKGKRATPRAAKHQPTLKAQVFAQTLDVGDEMPCRVLFQARVW